MPRSQRSAFMTVRTEGAILPSELLQRVAGGDGDLEGLKAGDYHLAEGEKLNERISSSWNRLLGVWGSFTERLSKLPEGDTGTSITRERWLLHVFDDLHYGRLTTSKAVEIEGKSYAISHMWQSAPIHLVGWNIDLDRRTRGVAGASAASPHSLLQEFLNRSDDHLWGFVSNGRRLRILRDNATLTRQAYVEFDLEAMMEGEVYSDFALLWLLCHQSRVEAERPEQCWLENWSQAAHQQGVRALDHLRDGVGQAINALGAGFVAYPGNTALRDKLRSGDLDKQDYYRQLLRIVYRLMFLFVAEDRDLLLAPDSSKDARECYDRFYSASRLRQLSIKRRGTRHPDLWRALWLVMQRLGSDSGCPELGLPALGSFLWSEEAVADLAYCDIANRDFLEAMRALCTVRERNVLRAVDYKNLGSEELGSIYESLLELHPEINLDAGTFSLATAGGHERKTTGSYYTPTSLINCLLDSALDPVLDEAANKEDPEQAILDLKVCDPACGSGHFLVAAAHRIAKRLAAVRTGDEEPSPESTRTALRDVIGRCIYGVDINPMSVELCKVSLWMEALEPGKPLSFLDHHIQCGNSLLGTTPALLGKGIPDEAFKPIEGDDRDYCKKYKKQNKEERESGQMFLEEAMPWDELGDLATSMAKLEDIDDTTLDGVRARQKRYEETVRSSGYLFGRLLADAWCAAFVWKKRKEPGLGFPITDSVFSRIRKNPHWAPDWMQQEIQRLSKQYQFFHWHLAFPDVFRLCSSASSSIGWDGGFDLVLGNPPWERIKLQEREWFAERVPEIANAPNTAARRQKILELRKEDAELYGNFLFARRRAEGESHLVRSTARYPLCGRGDVNTYSVFAELMRSLVCPTGRVGCIVPSGIATDDTTKLFFQDLIERRSLGSLFHFENEEFIFPSVHHAFRFCLLTASGNDSPIEKAEFIFFARQVAALSDDERRFRMSAEDIALINPNTRTCPIFRGPRDASITRAVYNGTPVLFRESPTELNPWRTSFMAMIHMSNDAELFHSRRQLADDNWRADKNVFTTEGKRCVPLWEAKMIHQFDHRFGTYEGQTEAQANQGKLPECNPEQHSDPELFSLPRYWVLETEVERRLGARWDRQWLLGWREISGTEKIRTVIASVIPRSAVGNKFLLMLPESPARLVSCLVANLNSFALDYVSRQKVGGTSMSYFVMKQLPVFAPEVYSSHANWAKHQQLEQWLALRTLELLYSAWDLQPFANDAGYDGPPFRWHEGRRFFLRCELDAAFFHLYLGTPDDWLKAAGEELLRYFPVPRDAVEHIMETFPIVKRRDVQQYGDYRTKLQILDIYDRMQHAIDTEEPYQTFLDPPPADPRVAHPPREENQ